MFRVYYLVNSMDQVKTALKNIEQSEIGTNRVHVMARDNGELSAGVSMRPRHGEDTNITTTGFYGAVVGAVIGLLVGWALSGIDPWGAGIGFWGVMVSVLFFGSNGAWAGGIRGISHANYHLKPYLDDIRKGHYLIIVDVDREEQRKKVHRLLDHSLDAERRATKARSARCCRPGKERSRPGRPPRLRRAASGGGLPPVLPSSVCRRRPGPWACGW